MNKTELAAAVAEKLGCTKKNAAAMTDALFEAMAEALANGETVSIAEFGAFAPKTRPAHEGINPGTKEKITIKASKTVGFKPYQQLKANLK